MPSSAGSASPDIFAPGPAPRREDEFLLACGVARFGGTAEPLRAAVREPLDWAYVGDAAARHGVLPLAYRDVLESCPGRVPQHVLAGWREGCTGIARRSLFLTGELLRLLALFESRGIRAVPYKGPVLAQLAYGDLALRDFCDIDLMIRRPDLDRARAVLAAEGYRPEFALTPGHEAAYVRSRHSLVFMDARGSIVEIHWAIQPRYYSFALDPETLWARLQPVRLAGRTVETFSREDLVLILCLHGAKHAWCRLEWIYDVAALCRTDAGMDWDRVLAESRRLGVRRAVLLGLGLASELLGAAVPAPVASALRGDAAVPALVRQVRGRLFLREEQPGLLESSAFFVRTRERLRDRARYWTLLAATPYVRDWAAVPLPGAMMPLYYLMRPFLMLGRYTSGAFRRE